jgi:hypothetical protein
MSLKTAAWESSKPAGLFLGLCLIGGFLVLSAREGHAALYATATDYTVGSAPAGIWLGNLRGKGTSRDMVVANSGDNTVSVRLCLDNGAFGQLINYSVGFNPVAVRTGNLNGDSYDDIVVANNGTNTVSVLVNQRDGVNFTTATNFVVGSSANPGPKAVTIADVNKDGKVDLLVANYGDNSVSVLLGLGGGAFGSCTNFPVGTGPSSIYAADFTGDGIVDVLTADYGSDTLTILPGLGNGSFDTGQTIACEANSHPSYALPADFNQDGHLDVAVALQGGNKVRVFFYNAGGYTAAADYTVGTGPRSLLLRDLNQDGYADMAVAVSGEDKLRVLLGSATGAFTDVGTFTVGDNPAVVVGSNFNSDNAGDLAVANTGSGTVSVLLYYTAPPTCVISSPANKYLTYGHLTTRTIQVRGTATFGLDAETNLMQVLVNLNSGGFQPVSSLAYAVGQTWNWTNTTTLVLGTNTFIAKSVDTYSGEEKAVTNIYYCIVDTNKPSCAILSPVDKLRTNAQLITVTGTAADLDQVASILYRVGHTVYGTNGFASATGTNSWTASATMQPGTNIFQVKSVDFTGNESSLLTRTISFVVTNSLTVNTLNRGYMMYGTNKLCIPPVATATVPLEINRNYTITAVPTNNHIFSNWVVAVDGGASTVTNRIYTFRMQTNLVLTADFETNRFLGASGIYWGLFADDPVAQQSAGLFKLTITSKQTFTGSLYMQGGTLSISGGTLNLDGYGESTVIKRDTKGKSNLKVAVQMTFDGSDIVSGTVTCFSNTIYAPEDGPFTAAMYGYKEGFNATNPTTAGTLAGAYNLAVEVPGDSASPKGCGYATLTVKTNGQAVPGSGKLGDYAAITPKTVVISKSGDWPFYAEPVSYKTDFIYTNAAGLRKTNKEPFGMIMGWLKFENNGVRELVDSLPPEGGVHWIKKQVASTNQFYPDGFTNWNLTVWGSAYDAPANAATDPALNIITGYATFVDGNLDPGGFANAFSQEIANKFVITPPNVNTQAISISTPKGTLSTTFYDPNALKKVTGYGVVLQDENIVRGVFLGTDASGAFLLESD